MIKNTRQSRQHLLLLEQLPLCCWDFVRGLEDWLPLRIKYLIPPCCLLRTTRCKTFTTPWLEDSVRNASVFDEFLMTSDAVSCLFNVFVWSGFACFCYILAFLIALIAAVYYSPLFCGSLKEKTMLRAPQELDNVQTQA